MIETISDPKNPNQNQQAPPQIYLPSCPPCNPPPCSPPPCNPPPCNPPPCNPPPYSPEDGHSDFDNAFEDKAIRRGFIRKVYGILCIQLSISLGSVLLFTMSKEAQNFAFNSFWFFIVAFGMSICTLCPMMCSQSLRRQTPHNYIFLILFTIAEAILIGYVAAATADRKPETGESLVMLAVVLTAGIVLGLTLFAFQTKWDLTVYNGTMFVILLCFTLSGFVVLFFRHIPIVRIMYSSIGALIFSIYIVIDTQLIVGGEHRKYQISSEEYIFASLLLYVDIIYLFIYILHMLNR